MKTNYIKTYTNFVNEALGVPENITNIARLVYDSLAEKFGEISKLSLDQLESREESSVEIHQKFKIGTQTFNKIQVYFDIRELEDDTSPKLVGANFMGPSMRVPGKTYSKNVKSDEILLNIRIGLTEGGDGRQVVEVLQNNRETLIPVFSHELHHAYGHQMADKESMTKRAEYSAFADANFGEIMPMNLFAHNLYYITAIENVVRPSEVAARIEDLGITKEKFYEFITGTEIFKDLKELKEFTYDKLRLQLAEYIPQIEEILTDLKLNIDGWSNDQKIDEILRLTMIAFANKQLEVFRDLGEPHPMELLFGKEKWDDFVEITKAHQTSIVRKHSNFKDYFTREIGKMNRAADATIRKISKLYAMTKTETANESVVNWKLWYKHFSTPIKWSTEIKTR